VVALNLLITAAEVIGGLLSGSLSLFSDALHNLSGAVALVVAWIATRPNSGPGVCEVRVVDYVDSKVPMLAKMYEKMRVGYRAIGDWEHDNATSLK